jgi:hypothetical protein
MLMIHFPTITPHCTLLFVCGDAATISWFTTRVMDGDAATPLVASDGVFAETQVDSLEDR